MAKAKAKVKIPLQVCILAGGLGTRLRSVLPDLPKVLAPVGDKSFLEYLVRYLCGQGFWRFVFLLGYRHEAVQECLEHKIRPAWPGAEWVVSVEPEPLGTGGAAKFAQAMLGEQFFLVNGDSYLEFDAAAMLRVHRASNAEATLAVRQVPDAGRYGSVEVDAGGRVVGFREKVAAGGPGLVNGGVYVLNRSVVESMPAGRPVSIERETFPAMLAAGRVMMSSRQDAGRFSDIGTPESYRQFQEMDF